jgi:hypothetical protein
MAVARTAGMTGARGFGPIPDRAGKVGAENPDREESVL